MAEAFNPWIVRTPQQIEQERSAQLKARRFARKAQFTADVERAYARQFEMRIDARAERKAREYADRVREIHDALKGRKFRSWYEATTGERIEDFLADVLLTAEQFEARDPRLSWRRDYLEWLEARIERVANENPWKNPELQAKWARELHDCTDPRERRRILMRLATPSWADLNKIKAIYAERDRIEQETGVPHDVDHIVPLVNRTVCGLHCEANLRIIPASVNRSKSNKYDPDLAHTA